MRTMAEVIAMVNNPKPITMQAVSYSNPTDLFIICDSIANVLNIVDVNALSFREHYNSSFGKLHMLGLRIQTNIIHKLT